MFTKFKKPFPPQNRILCFPRYKHRPIKLPPALITKEILGFDAKDVQDLANQQELMVYHRSVNEIIRQKVCFMKELEKGFQEEKASTNE